MGNALVKVVPITVLLAVIANDRLFASVCAEVKETQDIPEEYHPSNLDMGYEQTVIGRRLSEDIEDGDYVSASCTGADVVRDCLSLHCGTPDGRTSLADHYLDEEIGGNGAWTSGDEACAAFDRLSLYAAVPKTFIIGCQKCGSTSLHASLLRHPRIVGACGVNSIDTMQAGGGGPDALPGAHLRDDAIVVEGVDGYPKEPGIPGKELHYFDWDSRWQRGRAFYLCHFPRKIQTVHSTPNSINDKLVAIDSTPDYMLEPLAPQRVASLLKSYQDDSSSKSPAQLNSEGRFIIIVRDPVERWQSWFSMAYDAGWLSSTWELSALDDASKLNPSKAASEYVLREIDAIQRCTLHHSPKLRGIRRGSFDFWLELNSLCTSNGQVAEASANDVPATTHRSGILGGLYAAQLRNWLRYFDPSQFILLPMTELSRDPAGVMNAATDFLDLPRLPQDIANTVVEANGSEDDETAVSETTKAHKSNALLNATAVQVLREFYQPFQEDLMQLIARSNGKLVVPFSIEV